MIDRTRKGLGNNPTRQEITYSITNTSTIFNPFVSIKILIPFLFIMKNLGLVFLKIMLGARILRNGIVLEMKRKSINIMILTNG